MNKFEEYLNGLDKKNLVMLYMSLIIAAGVLYYNFNYSFLENKIEQNRAQIKKLLFKSIKSHDLNNKLIQLKKQYKKMEKKHMSLTEDLKYLNILINTSPILKLSDEKVLNILKDILQYAINNNIMASYKMQFVSNDYNAYIIDMQGTFDANYFMNFYKFVKSIEKMKVIKEIKILKIEKDKDIKFDMQIYFWGLK